jgi:hypothetical protein
VVAVALWVVRKALPLEELAVAVMDQEITIKSVTRQ